MYTTKYGSNSKYVYEMLLLDVELFSFNKKKNVRKTKSLSRYQPAVVDEQSSSNTLHVERFLFPDQ